MYKSNKRLSTVVKETGASVEGCNSSLDGFNYPGKEDKSGEVL